MEVFKMCEIQFIKRYDRNLNKDDVNEFIKMLEFGSLNNSDAFGLFNSYIVFKRAGLVDFKKFDLKVLTQDNFIIGHNRLSTGGKAKFNHNNHPFTLNNLVMVHNGIINNETELSNNKISKIDTDSYSVLQNINRLLKKYENKGKKRTDAIIRAIRKTASKIDGSYSIFIFDKITNNIFYFKNSKTSFYFIEIDKNILIGTTDTTKLKYIYKDKSYTSIEIEDDRVYLINNKLKLKDVGKFEEKKSVYSYCGYKDFEEQYKTYGQDLNQKLDNNIEDKQLFCEDALYFYLEYVPTFTFNNDMSKILLDDKQDIKELMLMIPSIMEYDEKNKTASISIKELQNILCEDRY